LPFSSRARVLAQTHVGDHEEIRNGLLHRPHRLLDDAVLGIGLAAPRVLLGGQAEEEHGGNAHGGGVLALLQQLVHGEPELPRHRCNGLTHAAAVDGEERIDEILYAELCLAHHLAQEGRFAKPARSIQGKRHGSVSIYPQHAFGMLTVGHPG